MQATIQEVDNGYVMTFDDDATATIRTTVHTNIDSVFEKLFEESRAESEHFCRESYGGVHVYGHVRHD